MKIKFIKFNKLNPMNKGFFIFILIIMLVILFLMPSIFALGITPGRTTIDFSPNLEREVQFSVVNTENKDMNIAFSVEGVLADYITINNNVASFTSLEKSKSFNYNLKLPRGLSPGLHKANIIALELPPGVENSGTIIQATVSVVTQVYVFVPYPGKYIEASLDIVNKENTNEVNFYIPFISRGEEKINSVKAVIDIYKENEKIASLNSNELSAESKERKE